MTTVVKLSIMSTTTVSNKETNSNKVDDGPFLDPKNREEKNEINETNKNGEDEKGEDENGEADDEDPFANMAPDIKIKMQKRLRNMQKKLKANVERWAAESVTKSSKKVSRKRKASALTSTTSGSPKPAKKKRKTLKRSNNVDAEPSIATGLKPITREHVRQAANKNVDGVQIMNNNLENSYLMLAGYLYINDTIQLKVVIEHNEIIKAYINKRKKAFKILN